MGTQMSNKITRVVDVIQTSPPPSDSRPSSQLISRSTWTMMTQKRHPSITCKVAKWQTKVVAMAKLLAAIKPRALLNCTLETKNCKHESEIWNRSWWLDSIQTKMIKTRQHGQAKVSIIGLGVQTVRSLTWTLKSKLWVTKECTRKRDPRLGTILIDFWTMSLCLATVEPISKAWSVSQVIVQPPRSFRCITNNSRLSNNSSNSNLD